MAISQNAKQVIERPLDRGRVKSRQGGQGMTFDYIPTEYAIQLLNEAFDYSWDSRVFMHEVTDSLAIVGVELKVWDEQGNPIIKQQFGSCNINRGVDMGSALKGAASDGLKKCASQFGLALELYLDEAPATGFQAPKRAPAAPPAAPPAPPQAPNRPAPPRPPAAPAAPPRPPADRETRVAPPAGPGSGPPRPPAPPASRPNPFGNPGTASVPKPAAPAPPAPPRAAAAAAPAAPAPPRPNPFGGGNDGAKGINSTQMAALTSLASKKGLSQPDLIALAQVADPQGSPKQTFEELTHSEAIQVIKAAQQ